MLVCHFFDGGIVFKGAVPSTLCIIIEATTSSLPRKGECLMDNSRTAISRFFVRIQF